MMRALRSGLIGPRTLASAVIACALLLRLLVPAGWMPVHTVHGWRLALCSGTGPIAMPGMPMSGAMHHGAMPGMMAGHGHEAPGQPQDHGSADHACPFSSLAMALDEPPVLAAILPPVAATPWLTRIAAIVSIGRGLAAPPPPATGPPLA